MESKLFLQAYNLTISCTLLLLLVIKWQNKKMYNRTINLKSMEYSKSFPLVENAIKETLIMKAKRCISGICHILKLVTSKHAHFHIQITQGAMWLTKL